MPENEIIAEVRRHTLIHRAVVLREPLAIEQVLNPDGTLRRYPMDHVPFGPRE